MSLLLYNKAQILYIMALYIFAKTSLKNIEIILFLQPALPTLYQIDSVLFRICILLLSTMKQFTNLCNRAISIKTRMTSFISPIAHTKKVNSNFKVNLITNLAIYLQFLLKLLLNIKDISNKIKNIGGLRIIHNKSKMNQRNILVTSFQNTKADQIWSMICNNIQLTMQVKKIMTQIIQLIFQTTIYRYTLRSFT